MDSLDDVFYGKTKEKEAEIVFGMKQQKVKELENSIIKLNYTVKRKEEEINEKDGAIKLLKGEIATLLAQHKGERICTHECSVCKHKYETNSYWGDKRTHCILNVQCQDFRDARIINNA